jgi:hypothetical protein
MGRMAEQQEEDESGMADYEYYCFEQMLRADPGYAIWRDFIDWLNAQERDNGDTHSH